jgi:hypothetical protein
MKKLNSEAQAPTGQDLFTSDDKVKQWMRLSVGNLLANLYRLCAALLQHSPIGRELCCFNTNIVIPSYNPSTTYIESKQVIKKILNVLEWDMRRKKNHGDIWALTTLRMKQGDLEVGWSSTPFMGSMCAHFSQRNFTIRRAPWYGRVVMFCSIVYKCQCLFGMT